MQPPQRLLAVRFILSDVALASMVRMVVCYYRYVVSLVRPVNQIEMRCECQGDLCGKRWLFLLNENCLVIGAQLGGRVTCGLQEGLSEFLFAVLDDGRMLRQVASDRAA